MSSSSDESELLVEDACIIADDDGNSCDEENDTDENVDDSGIAPFMFEPMRSAVTLQESDDEESSIHEESRVESPHRVGNKSWCLCGECQGMDTVMESICCKEIPSIPDEFYESTTTF